MARKHKKHHKSDKHDEETKDVAEVKPAGIKLVLKVGGATVSGTEPPKEHHESKKHKHKKKKKKHKHHHDDADEGERSSRHEKKKKKRDRDESHFEEAASSVPSPAVSLTQPLRKRARMSPAEMSPARMSPAGSRSPAVSASPAARIKGSPAPHRASPVPRRASPAPHKASPAPHRASPAPHRASPAPHRGSPAPHRASPAPHRGSPAPHRASPAPRRNSPAPQRGVSSCKASPVPTPQSSRPATPVVTPSPAEEPAPTPPSSAARALRDRSGREVSTLPQCLDYLHRQITRKDVHGFFAFPVTESIAPGYFSIVTNPMDLSSMQGKIDNGEYESVLEYKKDFKLMCDNCMLYNRPDTIFYKEAKRLLISGTRMMTKDKLLAMRKSLSFMSSVTNEELGLDQDDIISEAVTAQEVAPSPKPAAKLRTPKPKPSKFEAIPDDLTPEEILEQAQAAAKDAAANLTLRKPDSRLGFLRRQEDGTTTLNILNPDNDGMVSEKERVISLGTLAGKITAGTAILPGFKEDKRNKATPVTYMNYGPFCSYGPTYDSTFCTLSKNDSDLLLSTYGDETGMLYAKSLKAFVESCGEVATKMVDDLLDVLTAGEHSKTIAHLIKKEQEDQQRELEMLKAQGFNNFCALKSLEDNEIDMSFLDAYADDSIKQEPGDPDISQKLQETSQLLNDLEKTQYERLSQASSQLPHSNKPSQKEIQLANKVTKELTELAKQATPIELASLQGVRHAMGITIEPESGADAENEDAQSQVLTHLSSEEQPTDLEKDLQEFFEQGPTLRVCDSPSMMVQGSDGQFDTSQDV